MSKVFQTQHILKKCVVYKERLQTPGNTDEYHKRGTVEKIQEPRGKRSYFKLRPLGIGCNLNGV